MPSITRPDVPAGYSLLYADDALLIVDKPSGLLSVPGRGPDKADCLIARVQCDYADALIVHRLDYDTSGLLVLARGKAVHRELSILFAQRRVDKRYVAVIAGVPREECGEVDLPLIVDWPNRPLHKVDFEIGKPSRTRYRVLERDAERHGTRVELIPETGRTHQLRVHMQALGHPILGDPLYADAANRARATRLLLHAQVLAFAHPHGSQALRFESPAPF